MIGRMIPARTVQEHLQRLIQTADEETATNTIQDLISAADDMGLCTVDEYDDEGHAEAISWVSL